MSGDLGQSAENGSRPKPESDLAASQAWGSFNHHTPEAFWDVAIWRDGGWFGGSLDVADRKRIALAIIAATRVVPPGERDCNGSALGSSCDCGSSADCPLSPGSGGAA